MCSCRALDPVHLHDAGTSLLGNLLGQSLGAPAHPPPPAIPYGLCDCGASYLASAFAVEWVALAGMLIALVAGLRRARADKLSLVLICLWTGLIVWSFVAQLTGAIRRLTRAADPAAVAPLIEEYSSRLIASLPLQLAVDALLLFAAPACLGLLAARIATLPPVGSAASR